MYYMRRYLNKHKRVKFSIFFLFDFLRLLGIYLHVRFSTENKLDQNFFLCIGNHFRFVTNFIKFPVRILYLPYFTIFYSE